MFFPYCCDYCPVTLLVVMTTVQRIQAFSCAKGMTEPSWKYVCRTVLIFLLLLVLINQIQCTVRAPVFGRHHFFGTSEHYGKACGSLLSGWMNYNYTACCWFPTSNNILILPSQFWQISFKSYWLHCSKCRILVLLRYTIWHRGE